MVVIKFSRVGKTKLPIYRLITTDRAKDPWGKFLENLGTYNPHTKEAQLKAERIQYWISHGAQPSATVHNFLITQGIISGEKVRASKSKPGKKKQTAIDLKQKDDEAKKAAEAKAAEAAKQAAEEAKVAAEIPVEPAPAAEPAPIETPVAETPAPEAATPETPVAETPAPEITTPEIPTETKTE